MTPLINLFKRTRSRLRALSPRSLFRRLTAPLREFGERYSVEDNTQVTVYTGQPELFKGYDHIRPLEYGRGKRRLQVSLIATARNERENAARLLEGLMAQSRLPDEIVIVDTGSVDGTQALLAELASSSIVPVRILEAKGANIARGRNTAITAARFPVIAVTDFGCEIGPAWLESLVAPFEADGAIEVSAGRYEAVDEQGRPSRWLLGRTLDQIEPQNHLPSGVSIAFLKQVWQKVGGYPEWLSMTGEDTYFALELKRTTRCWAFVPEASVRWISPQSWLEYLRKAYRWSVGDGEAGTTARAYRWAAIKIGTMASALLVLVVVGLVAVLSGGPLWLGLYTLAAAVFLIWYSQRLVRRGSSVEGFLLLVGVYIAEIMGFWRGYRNRKAVDRRRFEQLQGIFFILAGVPIDDTGGGARWTQIALELVRRQQLVVFLYKFPKYESVELDLNIRHPNLLTWQVKDFEWDRFAASTLLHMEGRPITALVELPLEDYLPLIEEIRLRKGVVIYDLLDDWSTSLGGHWYSPEIEQKVIERSQVLAATAPHLADCLKQASGRSVRLLPNAVNTYLFDPRKDYPSPADFPKSEWSIIYTGALWGEWFDWELLADTAEAYPDASVLVIGDYHGQAPRRPSNLHFLGLKPQKTLPAYLAHAHVAIIPWKVSPITQATSPLKVYEYAAMRKPVVAPDLPALAGIPGVYRTGSRQEFIERVGAVRHAVVDSNDFAAANSWEARVDELLELARSASSSQN